MPVTAPERRLTRSAVTWQLYGTLAIWAFFLNALNPSVPFLRDYHNSSNTVAGMYGLALAVGSFVIGLVGARLVAQLGRHRALWCGVAALAAGALGVMAAPWAAMALAATLLAGAGGSLMGNVVVALLRDEYGPLAPAAMSESTALSAAVACAAPIVIAVTVHSGLGWRVGLMLVAVLAVGVAANGYRRPLRDAPRPAVASNGPLPATYWRAFVAMVMCCSIEFCLTIWSADLLRHRTGIAAGTAALSVFATIAGLATGRLAASRATQRMTLDALLYASLTAIVVGFAVMWCSSIAAVSFTGLFIAGLGLGPMYPVGVARTVAQAPHAPDRAINKTSLGIAPAIGAGPFVIGAMVDAVGIAEALLIVPVLAAVAAAAVWWSAAGGGSTPKLPPINADAVR